MIQRIKDYIKRIDKKFIGICLLGIIVISAICYFTGHTSYIQKQLPEEYNGNFEKLVINEVVTSNKGVYANKNNEVCDYIEIYNGNDYDINLNGYGLSDDEAKIKWLFTNTIIKAKDYAVINLVGKNTDDPLDANFKLSSSKTERIIFTNPNSKIIDAIDTIDMPKNSCMARDENGQWFISEYCTPGKENSLKGLEEYRQSLLDSKEECEIIINEFLARNKGNYLSDKKYNDCGAIEIKNISNHQVNLGNYYISKDIYSPFMKKLNDYLLSPNEIYVLYLDDGKYFESNYLGFNLPSSNGNIILGKNGKVTQEFDYSNLNNGDSMCYENGEYYHTSTISIGYENNAEGIEKFQSTNLKNKNGLIINEVCNSNSSYLVQNGNEYYDFIELYNNSTSDIDLKDYYLSDSDNDINKYNLPDIVLKANEYIVFMCSGNEKLTNTNYFHTNFKISDNDSLYLSDSNGIIDCMHIGNVPIGYSYGRNAQDGYYYMIPSPLEVNNDGFRTIPADPVINVKGGIYNDIDTLKVSITCFGDVYYTLNGNEPTKNDTKYTDEIQLNKTSVLKAKCINNKNNGSNTVTATYIINENHDLPVVSLSLNKEDFQNINANFRLHDYYFGGYVEYFDKGDGFASNCGIGIFGDESRQYAKKNYVMKFTKKFGADDLAYKVFEDRDYSSYDTLCLRAGGQDWDEGIIRDTYMTSLIDDYTSVTAYTTKNVVVYINGDYWGLYVLKEKKTRDFFEENYNINGDSINLVKGYLEADWGTMDKYEEVRQYCLNNDVTSKQAYDYLDTKLDLTNWADFWIGHLYCANIDYNNIRFFQSDEYNDGKWQCIFYDLDFGMNMDCTHNTYVRSLSRPDGFMCHWLDKNRVAHDRVDNTIIRSLLSNPYFQDLWLERLKYNLDTTWNKERMLNYLDKLTGEMSGEINHDRSRWGQSIDLYNQEIEKIRTFVTKRQDYIFKYTKDFFKLDGNILKAVTGQKIGTIIK